MDTHGETTADRGDLESADKPVEQSTSCVSPTYSETEWLALTEGSLWILESEQVRLERITGIDRAVVQRVASGEFVEVNTAQLHAPPQAVGLAPEVQRAIARLDTPEIIAAKAKESALSPYADGTPLLNSERASLADRFDVDLGTITRWLRQYRMVRHWSAFVKRKAGRKKGQTGLDPAVEAIIASAIAAQDEVSDDFNANTILKTIEERCLAGRLPVPEIRSVRARVVEHQSVLGNLPSDIAEQERRKRRIVRGGLSTPEVLSIAQVDHTPVDEVVNCPVTGRPIGCPTITIVFAVQPRVVLGLCLTLEAPSQLSTALALHHAVFPKDAWLERIGATGPWPFYGIMERLHTDNAPEFVTPHFARAALRWNIQTTFRRAGHPQDGGHIERFLGTLLGRIHGLKGSTRYRKQRRRKQGKSQHTLSTLETWIANEITAYHHEVHRTLGCTPAEAWERGCTTEEGIRLPTFPRDEREFLISFLPGESRVVTREGIQWKGIHYRSPALEPYIAAERRQFFRYDKRDITSIFFETPEGNHLQVPWTRGDFPTLSAWEWDELRPTLRLPARYTDGRVVHAAREANRELNRKLASSSQKARRRCVRELDWSTALSKESSASDVLHTTLISTNTPLKFEVLE